MMYPQYKRSRRGEWFDFLAITAAAACGLILWFQACDRPAFAQGQPEAVQEWQEVSEGVFHDPDGPAQDALPPVALLNMIRAGQTVSVWCQTAANVLALAATQAGLTATTGQLSDGEGGAHWYTVIDGCYYDADYGVYWTDENGDCVNVERVCDGDEGLTLQKIDKGWNDEATIRRLYADYCEVPTTSQGYACRYFRTSPCPHGLDFDCWEVNHNVCGCVFRGEIPSGLLKYKTLGRSKAALAKNKNWTDVLRKKTVYDEEGEPVVIDVPENNAAPMDVQCQ